MNVNRLSVNIQAKLKQQSVLLLFCYLSRKETKQTRLTNKTSRLSANRSGNNSFLTCSSVSPPNRLSGDRKRFSSYALRSSLDCCCFFLGDLIDVLLPFGYWLLMGSVRGDSVSLLLFDWVELKIECLLDS